MQCFTLKMLILILFIFVEIFDNKVVKYGIFNS